MKYGYDTNKSKSKSNNPVHSGMFLHLPRTGDIVKQLLKREAYWIHTLNTVKLNGLAVRRWKLGCFVLLNS